MKNIKNKIEFISILRKRSLVILFLILGLATFLRFYHLTSNPPSLNWDEISHGYNAYSILKTGADEWGVSWPSIFRAYGDYKLPVYIYLTSLSIGAFGLNDFAVRFPSALAGVLAVLFTYLLFKKLFKRESTSLLAAFFLTISPWHIFLSRPAFEANLASFLVIAGVYFFLKGLEKGWFLSLSAIFLGLSVYTYNSARIFTPLISIFLFFLYRQQIIVWIKKQKKQAILLLFLILVFIIPLIYSLASTSGLARFKWVGIIDQGMINRINMARGNSNLSKPLPRLIHNKGTYFVTAFFKNYFSNFSPSYLFVKGGSNYQYNIPGQGVIYPIQAPLILMGLYWLLKNWRRKESKLVLCWWLLAIIPSAATQENPHVLRTILVLPMPQILSALGFLHCWDVLRKREVARWVFIIIYSLILFFLLFKFLTGYFGSYREKYSWSWQYGYKQAVSFVKENQNDYQQIFINKRYGEAHEFLLFYLQWAPDKYRQDANLKRYFKTDWYWVDSFDKFVFVNDWEIKTKVECQSGNKCLLITSPGNYPEGWDKIETIDFLDKKPAFEILKK